MNRIRNVNLIPMGLSDAATELTLHTPIKRSTALGYGTAHLGGSGEGTATLDQTVALTTLDAFAETEGWRGWTSSRPT